MPWTDAIRRSDSNPLLLQSLHPSRQSMPKPMQSVSVHLTPRDITSPDYDAAVRQYNADMLYKEIGLTLGLGPIRHDEETITEREELRDVG
jgi:hypothetical protein